MISLHQVIPLPLLNAVILRENAMSSISTGHTSHKMLLLYAYETIEASIFKNWKRDTTLPDKLGN